MNFVSESGDYIDLLLSNMTSNPSEGDPQYGTFKQELKDSLGWDEAKLEDALAGNWNKGIEDDKSEFNKIAAKYQATNAVVAPNVRKNLLSPNFESWKAASLAGSEKIGSQQRNISLSVKEVKNKSEQGLKDAKAELDMAKKKLKSAKLERGKLEASNLSTDDIEEDIMNLKSEVEKADEKYAKEAQKAKTDDTTPSASFEEEVIVNMVYSDSDAAIDEDKISGWSLLMPESVGMALKIGKELKLSGSEKVSFSLEETKNYLFYPSSTWKEEMFANYAIERWISQNVSTQVDPATLRSEDSAIFKFYIDKQAYIYDFLLKTMSMLVADSPLFDPEKITELDLSNDSNDLAYDSCMPPSRPDLLDTENTRKKVRELYDSSLK